MRLKLLIFLFATILLSSTVLATFTMGEPPENVDVVEQQSLSLEDITGNAVAENNSDNEVAYIMFLISMVIVLLAAVLFLSQRVKPKN